MWLCWTETKQDQKIGKEMGKNKMAPKLPSHSKILQWFPMDNSICITHTGTQLLFCIFIVHTLAVPHLQLILETPYAPARQKHLNLPLLLSSCLAYAIPYACKPSPVSLSTFKKNLRSIPNDTSPNEIFPVSSHLYLSPICPLVIVSPLNSKVVCTSCFAFNLCFVPYTCLISSIHTPER